MSSRGWICRFDILIHLPTLTSSWLTRSDSSVAGGTSGTDIDATVMPGLTIAPGVHGPVQFAAYRVVGVINQTVPAPFGALALTLELVAPKNPYSGSTPAPALMYHGSRLNEAPTEIAYF